LRRNIPRIIEMAVASPVFMPDTPESSVGRKSKKLGNACGMRERQWQDFASKMYKVDEQNIQIVEM